MANETKPKSRPTAIDYERLGRVVESALIDDYVEMLGDTHRQLRLSFLRGMAAGLGGVIGATVVVGILVWILHLLGGVPVIGHFLIDTGNQIQR